MVEIISIGAAIISFICAALSHRHSTNAYKSLAFMIEEKDEKCWRKKSDLIKDMIYNHAMECGERHAQLLDEIRNIKLKLKDKC